MISYAKLHYATDEHNDIDMGYRQTLKMTATRISTVTQQRGDDGRDTLLRSENM